MSSTHFNFRKKIIRVRVTQDGRYLLKPDKIEGHRKVSYISYIVGHRIFVICSNRTLWFYNKILWCNLKHILRLGTFIPFSFPLLIRLHKLYARPESIKNWKSVRHSNSNSHYIKFNKFVGVLIWKIKVKNLEFRAWQNRKN